MSALPLNAHLTHVGPLVYGCMALGGDWSGGPVTEADVAHAHAAVEAALGIGIKLFDHADIYRRGKAEAVFGELLKRDAGLRAKVRLQSKCGIRFGDDTTPGRYDLSAEYIEASVDGILRRLAVEHIDILLLHRPDPLMQPAEVARAFGRLKAAGKVGHLGVSNMHAGQMRWLQSALSEPLVANQLEISLAKLDAIDAGTTFNDPQAATRPGGDAWAGTLEYAQQHGVQLQAWGSLAQGRFSDPTASAAAKVVHEVAETHRTTANAVLLAWLLRHPAGIQPVIGSGNAERIRACGDAVKIQLSREEWYRLYVAARGQALP
ncbi:aldo/keto reductase family oxidoreductase [Pelomonas sp. Root1444]|uniref:aldo/keto reductase n=1 Tax=Pelomonas sp. Root1444 TaxID=1736464 RepID=UPI0007030E8F|nr:aldo/keto reductase [Pelomonas sp. Root1444]KQY86802.1 aldo/keto reductase [Pelomonas sp. Root1444]